MRLLFASTHGYLDSSSSAALATREILELLAARGADCRVLSTGVLDYEQETALEEVMTTLQLPGQRRRVVLGQERTTEVIDMAVGGVRVTLMPAASSRPEQSPDPREAAVFLGLADQRLRGDRRLRGVMFFVFVQPDPQWLRHAEKLRRPAVKLKNQKQGLSPRSRSGLLGCHRLCARHSHQVNLYPNFENSKIIILQISIKVAKIPPLHRLRVVIISVHSQTLALDVHPREEMVPPVSQRTPDEKRTPGLAQQFLDLLSVRPPEIAYAAQLVSFARTLGLRFLPGRQEGVDCQCIGRTVSTAKGIHYTTFGIISIRIHIIKEIVSILGLQKIAELIKSGRIDVIDRILSIVLVEVAVSPGEANWVLRRPAPGLRVVVAGPEADQPGVAVVQAAGKAERLEAGVGVEQDVAEGVVVHPLGHGPGRRVDHQPELPRWSVMIR